MQIERLGFSLITLTLYFLKGQKIQLHLTQRKIKHGVEKQSLNQCSLQNLWYPRLYDSQNTAPKNKDFIYFSPFIIYLIDHL